MKKVIFLITMLAFSVTLFGQSNETKATKTDAEPAYLKYIQKYDETSTEAPVGTPDKKITQSKGLQKIEFASSGNIYSLLSTDQSVLTADQDKKAISFFARGGGTYGDTKNDLVINYTTDYGLNWTSYTVKSSGGKYFRYPSGGIMDFDSNASMDDAYAVFSGPITGGSGWTDNSFGSVKYDGTNENVTYDALPSGTYFAHANSNLTVCTDSTVHVAGDNFMGTSADYYWSNGLLYNGKLNPSTNQVDWDPIKRMNHSFAIDSSSMDPAASSVSMAWNEDGSVGYYIFLGRDSANDPRAYQPIVYKSTDAGQTWNKEPIFDFSTLDSLTNYIWNIDGPNDTTAMKKAFFSSEMDAVVDHNGLLHIIGIVQGSFSDHSDSLAYTYLYEPPKLFHVYMKSGGGWSAEYIHTMNTYNVTADDEQFGSGNDAVGWDHRINASRTENGEKIFAVWGDTDTTLAVQNDDGAPINSAPDIFAWGKDLTNNSYYPVKNFTKGTQFWGSNYFHYASDITLKDSANNYIIPVTTADKGATPLDPVNHNLLLSIGYGPSVGVEEESGVSRLSVSQNAPNPFRDQTQINVKIQKPAELSIKAYNMVGQQVFSKDKGQLSPGSYNFRISGKDLDSGVYFYQVQANDKSVTQKMIVQ